MSGTPLSNNEAPGSRRHLVGDPLLLTAAEMRMLLSELDRRLRDRGIGAAVYVVGGAALALTGDRDQLTPDIDALTTSTALWEEAAAIADEFGLPTTWINSAAAPYVPPRPPETLEPADTPGLRIDVAPREHLLAMKIAALRAKDRPDIERLLGELSLEDAAAEDFADLLERV